MVKSMFSDLEYLKSTLNQNSDFITREIDTIKNGKVCISFFESLCDSKMIYEYLLRNIDNYNALRKKFKDINDVISSPKLVDLKNIDDAFFYLENGFCIILYENKIKAIEVKANLDRGITTAQTELSMYGSKDSFCENYQKNLGVLKRRIKNNDLKVETIDVGIYTKNRIALVYIDAVASKKCLKLVKEKLNKLKDIEVTDSFDVARNLRLNKVIPTILKSEKPSLVARYLLKGYLVIMIDNTPFALIIDANLDNFVNPYTTDRFIKILRYICLFLTVLTPAIYIALINYNQETIPISLLIKFAAQRDSVPFPAIVEALLMLFTCEILREADIKFPNSYGSAASILGALILGESAVSAGIVSAIMIIIIAITFITNLIFTEIKLVSAIRIFRISLLFIASIFGIYGLSIAIILSLFIIANVKMYDGVYV